MTYDDKHDQFEDDEEFDDSDAFVRSTNGYVGDAETHTDPVVAWEDHAHEVTRLWRGQHPECRGRHDEGQERHDADPCADRQQVDEADSGGHCRYGVLADPGSGCRPANPSSVRCQNATSGSPDCQQR